MAETIQCNGMSGEALQIDRVWRGAIAGGQRGRDFILQVEAGQGPSLRFDTDWLRTDAPADAAQQDMAQQQAQDATMPAAPGLFELTIYAIEAGKPSRRRLFPPAQQFDGLLAGGQQLQMETLDGLRFVAATPEPGCYLVRLISAQGGGDAELLVRPYVQRLSSQSVQSAGIALGTEKSVTLAFETAETFLFRGTQGQRVRIDLARPTNADYALDPTVTLLGLPNHTGTEDTAVQATGWTQVGYDDDGGGDLNSRLDVTLPFTGVFAIAPGSINGEGAATLKLSGGEMARLTLATGLQANSAWLPTDGEETFFVLPAGTTEVQADGSEPFELGIENPLSPGSFASLQSAAMRPDGSWGLVLPGNRPRNLLIRFLGSGSIRACRAACPRVDVETE